MNPTEAGDRRLPASAAERNAEPIRQVLARVLPPSGLVLEIASGSGLHAAHMAGALPQLRWQPTDRDPDALASIAAWREASGASNLAEPLVLDVFDQPWPVAAADAVVCINMIHIAPWPATLALIAGAGKVLASGGVLVTYGPYLIDGATAPSNLAFDQNLRGRNPAWGVRELRELETAAKTVGFGLEEIVAMPANNHTLVFRRD